MSVTKQIWYPDWEEDVIAVSSPGSLIERHYDWLIFHIDSFCQSRCVMEENSLTQLCSSFILMSWLNLFIEMKPPEKIWEKSPEVLFTAWKHNVCTCCVYLSALNKVKGLQYMDKSMWTSPGRLTYPATTCGWLGVHILLVIFTKLQPNFNLNLKLINTNRIICPHLFTLEPNM